MGIDILKARSGKEGSSMYLSFSDSILQQMRDEASRCYPEEACGVLLAHEGTLGEVSDVVCCQNIQNRLHEAYPERYPRTAQTAYAIDPKEFDQIQIKARTEKKHIVTIFHSHPDHDAYFSEEDQSMAAPWGEPLFPMITYIVLSVYDRRVKRISEFYWDKKEKKYLERNVR